MLEWYRIGIDDTKLMNDVERLLTRLLPTRAISHFTYAELFELHFHINPHAVDVVKLNQLVGMHTSYKADVSGALECDQALDILMTEVVEPNLTRGIVFIREYPASHAALAKLAETEIEGKGYPIARRFEVYVDGIELANGYWELTDMQEQKLRFEKDNLTRLKRGLQEVEIDRLLLEQVGENMPDCAGVALGVDRLLMLIMEADSLSEVMLFDD